MRLAVQDAEAPARTLGFHHPGKALFFSSPPLPELSGEARFSYVGFDRARDRGLLHEERSQRIYEVPGKAELGAEAARPLPGRYADAIRKGKTLLIRAGDTNGGAVGTVIVEGVDTRRRARGESSRCGTGGARSSKGSSIGAGDQRRRRTRG